jgi:hypothetical protein
VRLWRRVSLLAAYESTEERDTVPAEVPRCGVVSSVPLTGADRSVRIQIGAVPKDPQDNKKENQLRIQALSAKGDSLFVLTIL